MAIDDRMTQLASTGPEMIQDPQDPQDPQVSGQRQNFTFWHQAFIPFRV